jgi:hypothetical protein
MEDKSIPPKIRIFLIGILVLIFAFICFGLPFLIPNNASEIRQETMQAIRNDPTNIAIETAEVAQWKNFSHLCQSTTMSQNEKANGTLWLVDIENGYKNECPLSSEQNGYALSFSESNTLICISYQRIQVGVCYYKGGVSIPLEAVNTIVSLIDIKSETKVAEGLLPGKQPPSICVGSIAVNPSGLYYPIEGERASRQEILDWVNQNWEP